MRRIVLFAVLLASYASGAAADTIWLTARGESRLGGAGPFRGVVRSPDAEGFLWQAAEPGWERSRPLVRIAWKEVKRIDHSIDTIDDIVQARDTIEHWVETGVHLGPQGSKIAGDPQAGPLVFSLVEGCARAVLEGGEPDPGYSRSARDYVRLLVGHGGLTEAADDLRRRTLRYDARRGVEVILNKASRAIVEGKTDLHVHMALEVMELVPWLEDQAREIAHALAPLALLVPPATGEGALARRLVELRNKSAAALVDLARVRPNAMLALLERAREPGSFEDVALAARALGQCDSQRVVQIASETVDRISSRVRDGGEPFPYDERLLEHLLSESEVARGLVEARLLDLDVGGDADLQEYTRQLRILFSRILAGVGDGTLPARSGSR